MFFICVLCSNQQPDDCTFFFFGRNFFQFCNNWCSYFDTTDDYMRFISTVGQTTVPFWGGGRNFSGCNLNPPKNMASQMTVCTFISGSIFFRSYVSKYEHQLRMEKITTGTKKVLSFATHVTFYFYYVCT
jgi:hypothetical protein